ncbi:NADH dehydrogenase-like protein YumB [Paraliobacillus quinghaiensis]|uniref:NADH dehydrogenase-like protein YumB n=1 Tax=Paraliobacillus quinghaiensis TaxID=470815 RepID=A0A917TV31_9BACI|nr:NAD(P)/FAD-dependent oxidoreductase [Paraliobacillus quinghaiensis]GGM37160.1 NADH dehydrogenase-like protein YumB [Paraliobacillus quinghaiensis]
MVKKKILIIGAGYAGIATAVKLQKKITKNDNVEIFLVNKHDYHYQTTWLHENAVGVRTDEQTMIPIKDLIDQSKVTFIKDTVTALEVKQKKVQLAKSTLDYDYLVVALGFEVDTSQILGLDDYAYPLGTLEQARTLREQLEMQLAGFNKSRTNTPLTLVIGGGGFTGVVYLGELVNRLPDLCEKYNVDRADVKVIAVEKEPSVMPDFDPELGEYAMRYLEERGVEFRLGTAVKKVESDCVTVEKAGRVETIKSSLLFWSAGVRANRLIEKSDIPDKNGSVEVQDDLRAPGYDDVFVIGDCAAVYPKNSKAPYRATAQIAMQQAEVCASNLVKIVNNNQNLNVFQFNDPGTIASLGRKDAIGIISNNKKVFGRTASILKKIIDNRFLYQIGGLSLLLKKRKL